MYPDSTLKQFTNKVNSHSPKKHGYGTWEVTCPTCGEIRMLRAHKYVNGRVRGEENDCHPCRAKKLSRRIDVICSVCGEVRSMTISDAKQRLTDRCIKCKGRGTISHLGGNRRLTARGYVKLVGLKGHPLEDKSRSVLEHWFVMYEQHPIGQSAVLGLKEQKFTIHHRDGNRANNQIENLEFRSMGSHPIGQSLKDVPTEMLEYELSQR